MKAKAVVGFLQNVWVKDPERLKRMFEQEPEIREHMIESLLFMGCLTGRRLTKAFGDWCDRIVWEETTKEIAGDPRTIFPVDVDHILAVIEKHQPSHIIVFGQHAATAFRLKDPRMEELLLHRTVWYAPHPAARQADVPARLKFIGEELAKQLLDQEIRKIARPHPPRLSPRAPSPPREGGIDKRGGKLEGTT